MAKYLRDLAIYANEKIVTDFRDGFVMRFHRESCCIVELYLSLLNKNLMTFGIVKVLLEYSHLLNGPPEPKDVKTLIDVIVMPWPFNFHDYVHADYSRKKLLIAESLSSALLWLAEKRGWSKSPIADAHTKAKQRDFVFTGISKMSWPSPSGLFRVRIGFQFELDGVHLYGVLFKNRSKVEIARKPLGVGIAQEGCLDNFLKNGRWASETVFSAKSTDFVGQKWKVDFAEVIQGSSTR